VLPENIGLAVAVEISRCFDMPRGANIGKGTAACMVQTTGKPEPFWRRMSLVPSPLKSLEWRQRADRTEEVKM
jgi:hypothetical protein